jgi:hypothetical protein
MKNWAYLMIWLCACNWLLAAEPVTKLKSDESVTLFPALGWRNPSAEGWVIEFHGWVYEREPRGASVRVLEKLWGLKLEDLSGEDQQCFKERSRWFLVDNERGKNLHVTFDGRSIDLGKTGSDGHLQAKVTTDGWLFNGLKPMAGQTNAVLKEGTNVVTLKLAEKDKRVIQGAVHLVGEEGWTVVSDIDDTIKVTEVRNKEALVRNTFCRAFQPAEGMAKVYTEWAGQGAVFHYVSASPWQLYPDLEAFRAEHQYPAGTFHLRDLRVKDQSGVEFLRNSGEFKPSEIGRLLTRFPKRKFVLVGDSGEHDPEIYGELARKHPAQVVRVLIRDVTQETAEAERYRAAFQGVTREKWAIFKHPDEVKHLGPVKGEEKGR